MLMRLYGFSSWHYWETQSHSKLTDLVVLTIFLPPFLQCSLSPRCGIYFEDVYIGNGTGLHSSAFWVAVAFWSLPISKRSFLEDRQGLHLSAGTTINVWIVVRDHVGLISSHRRFSCYFLYPKTLGWEIRGIPLNKDTYSLHTHQ